ncbi:MAG: Iron-regulated transporter rane component SufB [Patescibacteria group bacterium]|jgi:Fe-S cluster assembly protein SufB|nr:Iron-regulated transporter rane component SufB [Patescibacteria group bacterium]
MQSTAFVHTPYRYGFSDPEEYLARTTKGLSEDVVRAISAFKKEPEWMLEKRLEAYKIFLEKPLPNWGADLSKLDFDQMTYFMRAQDKPARDWDDVPDTIKNTFDRLGVPQAERKFLAGVGAQYESEVIYHSLQKEWEDLGVIFTDTDTALRDHPEIIKKHFGTIIPSHDHKFAALNTAVWSGGSFVYIPQGVHVTIPLQAYFRINAKNAGQFERTLIIAEEDSYVHYVEGCSAPTYSSDSLHSAVVEVIVKPGARVRYTTIQNWSDNVYNLVTKRAVAHKNATMEWVDCNLGSQVTMKYPCVVMVGEGARAEVLSLALAGHGQHQDAGAKMIHLAPNTSSYITAKSVSHSGGRTSYRGLVRTNKKAKNSVSKVVCDALLLDDKSQSDTYPTIDISQKDTRIEHEATVSKVGEEQLFYLRSRGLSETEASTLIVNGFLEPIVKELPMEFAVEMNRLIELQMEGSIG